jgi:hypothetical protein
LKDKKRKRRTSFFEKTILVLIVVMAFLLAGAAHDTGIGQRWGTVVFGTIVPFSFVVYARRKTLSWPFLMALVICLAIHVLAIWGDFSVRLGYL